MQKKNIFLGLFCSLLSLPIFAQFEPVREMERMMSFGSRPGFTMDFANTDEKVVENTWKNFAKQNFKAKLKKSKGEWAASKLKSSMMGDDVFTIYSTIEKNGDKTTLNVWIDAGSYFLNRRDNPGRTQEMVRALRQFYYDVRREAIGQELKNEEAALKEMESKQKKMAKENEKLRSNIQSWEANIQKAKQDIVDNEKSQEANLVEQENQRRLLEETRQRLNNVESEN